VSPADCFGNFGPAQQPGPFRTPRIIPKSRTLAQAGMAFAPGHVELQRCGKPVAHDIEGCRVVEKTALRSLNLGFMQLAAPSPPAGDRPNRSIFPLAPAVQHALCNNTRFATTRALQEVARQPKSQLIL